MWYNLLGDYWGRLLYNLMSIKNNRSFTSWSWPYTMLIVRISDNDSVYCVLWELKWFFESTRLKLALKKSISARLCLMIIFGSIKVWWCGWLDWSPIGDCLTIEEKLWWLNIRFWFVNGEYWFPWSGKSRLWRLCIW